MFTQSASTSGLSPGSHKLYFRTKDQSSQWSAPVGVSFVVSEEGTGKRKIASSEYFFNTDPGIGLANAISFSPDSFINVSHTASIAGLPKAEHTLYVRMKNVAGEWGKAVGQKFLVTDSIKGNVITRAEYFFDSDPGAGNGTFIPLSGFTAFQEATTTALLTALPAKMHRLFVRFRDDQNRWGNPIGVSFVVSEPPAGKRNITAAEYFFDNEPGFGKGRGLSFSADAMINVAQSASLAGLFKGNHKVFVRAKNGLGEWGSPLGVHFLISDTTGGQFIKRVEFFVDSDPGNGQASSIPVIGSPTSASLQTSTSLSGYDAGPHRLFARLMDDRGQWGSPVSAPFVVNKATHIAGTEYFVDMLGVPGTGKPMSPVDTVFNSAAEYAVASVDTSITKEGKHKIYVRVRDSGGQWSTSVQDSLLFEKTVVVKYSATTLDFGRVKLGDFKEAVITISSTGRDTLKISSITSTNPVFSARPTQRSVPSGQSFQDTIRFAPTVGGDQSGVLLISGNASVTPDTIKLSGFGAVYALQLSSNNVSFGSVRVGQFKDTAVTFTNSGNDTLKIASISSTNPVFYVRPATRNLLPAQSFQDTIRFAPATGGNVSGLVLISSNASATPDTIKVSGFGAIYTAQFSSKSIHFGRASVGKFKDTTVTMTNTGNDTLRVSTVTSPDTIFSGRPKSFVIAPGASFKDTLRFKPATVDSIPGLLVFVSNATSSPDTIRVSGRGDPPTSVENLTDLIPKRYALLQNYPNPFNPTTVIRYGLPRTTDVSIKVFNILGQVVDVLVDQEQKAGYYSVQWKPSLPSGVYFYRMQAGDFVALKKLVLLR